MIINEQITWRRGHEDLAREPQSEDVAQGLAGIFFSGELLMNEGSKVEVVDGKLLFTSGRSSFGRKVGEAVEKGYRESEPAAGQTHEQTWGLRLEAAENGKMYLAGIGQGIEAGAMQATRSNPNLDPAWVLRKDGTYEIEAQDLLRIILSCRY